MKSAPFDKEALIRRRLGQARETLRDAHVLSEQKGTPASVVNRSYYAIFYAVLALIGTMKKDVDTSKHKGVIAVFNQEFVKTGIFPKEMSKSLRRAFEARQEGDYRASKIDEPTARENLIAADDFVSAVERYLLDRKFK
ncbi:MAG: HEPN domain-containing protein [Chloroflexota bacterium]